MPDYFWSHYSKNRLLELKLCELGLTLEGTWLEPLLDRVIQEIRARDLQFKPHFWLSDEWFCPKGVPGVAIPFFLAHPRLMRLEKSEMFEVEGGTRRDCLKLLRHEVGHAIQNAFELHRRKSWQKVFGHSTEPYPKAYLPDPTSKDYVQHLNGWYAQSHPEEDFAETFAVWLSISDWRRRYRGWGATEKLEFVDELMQSLVGQKPRVTTRRRPDSLSRLKKTLAQHYEERKQYYARDNFETYDHDLRRLFTSPDANGESSYGPRAPTAAEFIRKNQSLIRAVVGRWTGEYQHVLDEVLLEIRRRCKELGLVAAGDPHQLLHDFSIMLTVHITLRVYVHREWRLV